MKIICSLLLLICISIFLQSASCNAVNVKTPEYIGIKSTEIENLSFKNSAIKINLEYNNPNNFGLDVKETNLQVFVNDRFIANADQPEKTFIPKQGRFVFPIVARFETLKLVGTALQSMLSKNQTKLTIKGTAKVGKGGIFVKVPIAIEENVELNKK